MPVLVIHPALRQVPHFQAVPLDACFALGGEDSLEDLSKDARHLGLLPVPGFAGGGEVGRVVWVSHGPDVPEEML